jgi:hypothetical protein
VTARDARTFRASLDARLMNRSRETGYDVNRLRRHVVFYRILARLAVREGWALKGGFALESGWLRVRADREGPRPRVARGGRRSSHALADDPDGDGFAFETRRSGAIAPGDPENNAWRFSITCRLAGREFASVVVDVVPCAAEMADAVGPIVLPPPVPAAGLEPIRIAAVDVARHAAEKYLVDLVLMLETGLLPDPRLGERLRAVYDIRDGRAVPTVLPGAELRPKAYHYRYASGIPGGHRHGNPVRRSWTW